MTSNPADLKIDVREDEEQYQRLQDCVDVLVASGYFRARIKGLSAFDKIVGGMCWCLSICNFSVDVDLLYSESATIGQKIALTEKIVTVLTHLKCPHPLEPHQIQGLDFIHIFPVIQWLVKRAIETKKEHGDDITAFCDYVAQSGSSKEEDPKTKMFEAFVATTVPQRVRKRGPNTKPANLMQDAACAVAEFDLTSGSGTHAEYEGGVEELMYSLEESNLRDKISKTRFKDLMESVMTQSSEPVDEAAELRRKIEQLNAETKLVEDALEEARNVKTAEDEASRERDDEQERKLAILAQYSEEEIEQVKQLLDDYQKAVQQEKTYKASCREEMAKMEEEIEQLQHFDELSEENKTVAERELDDELQELDQRVQVRRLELAEVSRDVSRLQRQLDSVPSQLELTQYQQRFIELYNQMASKHRQTKQYITLHNTLIDVHAFMKGEIGMLNKIEDVLPHIGKESNQDALLQNLHEILRAVEGSHDKLNRRSTELERGKNELVLELAQLKDNESKFHLVSEEFKEACKRNEELLRQLQA